MPVAMGFSWLRDGQTNLPCATSAARWEASWDDLVNVLTTGPWQQRATIFAMCMQLAKLRLQPHQPVEQLVRKVNSLAEKLKGLRGALSDDERTFALQRALIEQVPH